VSITKPEPTLSFPEISANWAAMSGLPPDRMMRALISSFWRGELQGVFRPVPSRSTDGGAEEFVMRTADGDFVRNHNHSSRELTALDDRFPIARNEVATVLGGDPVYWPTNLEWNGSDKQFFLFSEWPLTRWPRRTIEEHFNQWRLRRSDFARWFTGPGAPVSRLRLDEIWPVAGDVPSTMVLNSSLSPLTKTPRKKRIQPLIIDFLKDRFPPEEYPKGVPDIPYVDPASLLDEVRKSHRKLNSCARETMVAAISAYNATRS
jgi:hypothetical protein